MTNRMNESNPLVSIIIPAFNRADFIAETLDSVYNQTYYNWECIVIDDGSVDDTVEIVERYCFLDTRFKLYQRDRESKGAPTCRNIGLDKSKGQFIIFLDSDDLLATFCLEKRIFYIQKYSECDFLVFPSILFEKQLDDLNILWNIDSEEDDLERFLRIDALWPISGPIYRKKTLLKVMGFKEGLLFWQDVELAIRLLLLQFKYKKFLDGDPRYLYKVALQ